MTEAPSPEHGGGAGQDVQGRPPLHVRLPLPYPVPPAALRGNYRSGHYGGRSRASKQVRGDVMQLGRSIGLHRLTGVEHVTVQLVWAPGDRRDRDADNLYPFLKAICDGLARGNRNWVGLDLVPKDTPQWMDKPTPLIVPPPAKGLWVEVTVRFTGGAS